MLAYFALKCVFFNVIPKKKQYIKKEKGKNYSTNKNFA